MIVSIDVYVVNVHLICNGITFKNISRCTIQSARFCDELYEGTSGKYIILQVVDRQFDRVVTVNS